MEVSPWICQGKPEDRSGSEAALVDWWQGEIVKCLLTEHIQEKGVGTLLLEGTIIRPGHSGQ